MLGEGPEGVPPKGRPSGGGVPPGGVNRASPHLDAPRGLPVNLLHEIPVRWFLPMQRPEDEDSVPVRSGGPGSYEPVRARAPPSLSARFYSRILVTCSRDAPAASRAAASCQSPSDRAISSAFSKPRRSNWSLRHSSVRSSRPSTRTGATSVSGSTVIPPRYNAGDGAHPASGEGPLLHPALRRVLGYTGLANAVGRLPL